MLAEMRMPRHFSVAKNALLCDVLLREPPRVLAKSRAAFPRCNAIPRVPRFLHERRKCIQQKLSRTLSLAITYCYNFSPRRIVRSAKGRTVVERE